MRLRTLLEPTNVPNDSMSVVQVLAQVDQTSGAYQAGRFVGYAVVGILVAAIVWTLVKKKT